MSDFLKTEACMYDWAQVLDQSIKDMFGPKGFCIIVFDFDTPELSNYVSNADRSDMIKSLRETADRLEKRQDIPRAFPVEQ